MRLILSSRDFGGDASRSAILRQLSKPLHACRTLFVPNERATHERIAGGLYHARLQKYGFNPALVAVFDEASDTGYASLPLDLIYISGGNTFATLDELRKTGLDRVIENHVRRGVIYIGGSAGAHIASKDVSHVLEADENAVGLSDFRALGLLNGVLICHYTEARRPWLERARLGAYPVYALTDGDTLVVTDKAVTKIEGCG